MQTSKPTAVSGFVDGFKLHCTVTVFSSVASYCLTGILCLRAYNRDMIRFTHKRQTCRLPRATKVARYCMPHKTANKPTYRVKLCTTHRQLLTHRHNAALYVQHSDTMQTAESHEYVDQHSVKCVLHLAMQTPPFTAKAARVHYNLTCRCACLLPLTAATPNMNWERLSADMDPALATPTCTSCFTVSGHFTLRRSLVCADMKTA